MANNVIKRVWNQNRMVAIEDLKGMTFQAESGGHTFQISGVDDAGNVIALSGSVAGVFLRPDNTDVAITGSASGGVVSVTLPANCYDVPGRFGLTVFVTANGQKTAVYAAIGTVSRTSSGTVSPGTTSDVVDLINRINAAVATIPASWTGLMADIAPTYSDAAVYPVGAYCYYNGDLYRCTTAITTAESWTAGHWTQAVLGNDVSDLKSALTQANIIDLGSQLFQNTGYYIKNNQAVGSYCDVSVHVENENYACVLAEHIAKGQKFYFVGQVTGANGKLYAWLDSEHNVVSNSGDTYSISGAVIECPVDNGTLVCSANTVDVALKVIAIKEDCNDTYAYFSNGLQPTFTETLNLGSTSISVKFPNAEFRLYRKDGTRFVVTTAYTNQTFTVSNLQKLIYDLSDSTVKVISMTEVRFNTITLLAVISEGVDGAFACFYNRYVNARDWDKTQLTAYFSAGQSPYFQVINITSTAKIKVLFPTGDFRIYGLTGMFYKTSSYGGTEFVIETLKKLVYDVANNVITVVSNTASGNYINLLSVEGQGISGLLAKYFYANNDYYTRQELYDVNSANFGTDVKLLFYSDVHGSIENVKRIINKAESYNVNAIVCGGDIVPFNIGQGLSWYEELAATTTKDMLTCVGNHDVWSNADTQTLATKSDVYNAVIAPMVARVSDIVQPTGASTNYDLYFYKDYGGIRMIFLDAMVTTGGVSVGWWDTTQLAWLENVLADAKTNSKSVVIVAHPPFDKNIAIRDNSSPVNSWIDYRNYNLYEGIHLPESAMEAVKDFIDGGGKFVCWLSGHVHVDSLLTATGYTGQVMINIMSARYNYHPDGTAYYLSSYSREKWFDSYDYITFDTTHKMIKVIRIGYCEDGSMRRRERFCYDYGNKTLLSVS